MGELTYAVSVSDRPAQTGVGPAPNGEPASWSPISSTLIAGERDAVLVDPPMTTAQTERVGDWVAASGKRLTHVYVTHGHGDHWFGTAPLLDRFPGAVAVATPGTIEVMHEQGSAATRARRWDAIFPEQIPAAPVLARPLEDGVLTLEGHELRAVEVGHTDTDATTVLHVPSIGLVVAGDAVYNGVHQMLAYAGSHGLDDWLHALDLVAALEPRAVVAGHKDVALPDDPACVGQTREYLRAAQQLRDELGTAIEFFAAMLERYPERLNAGALWRSAVGLFPEAAVTA